MTFVQNYNFILAHPTYISSVALPAQLVFIIWIDTVNSVNVIAYLLCYMFFELENILTNISGKVGLGDLRFGIGCVIQIKET